MLCKLIVSTGQFYRAFRTETVVTKKMTKQNRLKTEIETVNSWTYLVVALERIYPAGYDADIRSLISAHAGRVPHSQMFWLAQGRHVICRLRQPNNSIFYWGGFKFRHSPDANLGTCSANSRSAHIVLRSHLISI